MKILYFLLLLLLIPVFMVYLLSCFIVPSIRFGDIFVGNETKIYITKDLVHSDYVFESKQIRDLFICKSNFVKIGWGDRKIFLETKKWSELNPLNFLKAFFGLNKTVLRLEEMESLPKTYKEINLSYKQLEIIKNHINKSTNKKIIIKTEKYYQYGSFYESDLKYNCVTNCNNWVNKGLRLANISNRFWCPITFWI